MGSNVGDEDGLAEDVCDGTGLGTFVGVADGRVAVGDTDGNEDDRFNEG